MDRIIVYSFTSALAVFIISSSQSYERGIDSHYPGSGLLGDKVGIAAVEFRLYKDDAYLLLLAGVYQALQMGGGGLLSTCLDRNLVQVVVAGKVGKCRMINHEGTGRHSGWKASGR